MGRSVDLALKRALDIVGAVSGLVLLSPLLAAVALAVRLRLGTPVLFRQVRAGKNGKPFTMVKFRTMTDARDSSGQLLGDDQRLTPFGHLLRSTSLDELPELWNVLKGEMSLVGPRPLHMSYLPLYNREQARRHNVRPGITGWAQIKGRNELDWPTKLSLDVYYADHRTFLLDLSILVATIVAVLTRKGISGAGEATMSAFTGTAPARASSNGSMGAPLRNELSAETTKGPGT